MSRVIKGVIEKKDALKGIVVVGGVEYYATKESRMHCLTVPEGDDATLTVDDDGNVTDISPKIAPTEASTAMPSPKARTVWDGKDLLIVRQTCLKCASEIYANKGDFDERRLFELAHKMTAWVVR